MTSASHSRDPVSLYAAAQDRMASAWMLHKQTDTPYAAYTAGLAVETILQALAHFDGAEHDARHRLDIWLAKCSPVLQDTTRQDAGDSWSWIDAVWSNGLRYHSKDQWLGAARKQQTWRVLQGNNEQRLHEYTRRLIKAAQFIFGKAMAEWQRKNKSSRP